MAKGLFSAQAMAGAWVRCLTRDLSDPDQAINAMSGPRYTSRMLIDDLRAGKLPGLGITPFWSPTPDVRILLTENTSPNELILEVRVQYDLPAVAFYWAPIAQIPTPAWALTQTSTPAIPPPPPSQPTINPLSTVPLTQQIKAVHQALSFTARDYEIAPAQSKPTHSSGPPCRTCGGPTTLLFIHSVCDRCEPAGGSDR